VRDPDDADLIDELDAEEKLSLPGRVGDDFDDDLPGERDTRPSS
jgi:hypothetical protein